MIAGLSMMSGNFMLWSEIKSVQVLKYGAVNDPENDTDVFGCDFQWGTGGVLEFGASVFPDS